MKEKQHCSFVGLSPRRDEQDLAAGLRSEGCGGVPPCLSICTVRFLSFKMMHSAAVRAFLARLESPDDDEIDEREEKEEAFSDLERRGVCLLLLLVSSPSPPPPPPPQNTPLSSLDDP